MSSAQRLAQRLRPVILSPDTLPALAVFAGALALYLPTLAPGVAPGDGGELQTLTGVLGIAHPTGYPLLLLLGRAFAALPLGGDLAHRVTLLGALFTAAAAVGMYCALRELKVRPLLALAGGWLMAAAPRLWMHAVAAEVYPLSELLLILGLWWLLRWGHGRAPLWAPMLALGFGLSHHVSIRLFGPAVLAYLLVVNPRLPLQPKRWLPALLALALPLGVYAYLPLRFAYFKGLPAYSGEVLGIPGLVAAGLVSPHYWGQGALGLFLAQTYSTGFLHGGLAISAAAVQGFGDMLRLQFPLAAAPVILLGVFALIRRQWRAAVLVLLGAAVTLLLALRFLTMYGEDGDHFIPVYMLLALCYGVGAEALFGWVERRFACQRWLAALLAAALVLVPVYSAVVHLPLMRQLQRPAQPPLLTAELPQGAVIAGQWHDITPLWYQQRINGVRPDLWIMQSDAPGITMLVQRALSSNTPFYELRSTAAGLRLLPIPLRDEAAIQHPASPEQQQMSEAIRWRGYSLSAAPVRAGEVLQITLYWQVLQPVTGEWKTFIHLIGDDGMPVAQVDRQPIGPEFSLAQWQAGLLLADPYEIAVPADLRPGRYRLVFGWYQGGERLKWGNGQDTQVLTEIEVAAR
jgi:hypothetical protein